MDKKLKEVKPYEEMGAYYKVQNYFFDYPTKEISLNDLCSAVKISKTTANAIVKRLTKTGFLKIEIIGKLWRISCNLEHNYNVSRKTSYHLGLIYESGIIKAVHEALPSVRTIILFGSYRKGDDTESSDVDIAAEVIGDSKYEIVELGIIPQLGYRQNVTVNLHIFSRNDISLNLFANIVNGIILEGFLEVKT